jgi:predicted MFS family arabinose efflux permease
MQISAPRTYSYRWVILAVFAAAIAVNQIAWITFAPITDSAAAYYGVSTLAIGLLSAIFMLVYIVVSIPASWVIDTYGFRVAVGIGALLTGIFGLMRGVFAANFALVFVAQIGIATGQPFIVNAITKVAARWFPPGERATASGVGSLGMYVGIVLGLALTPILAGQFGLASMLMIYGVLCLAVALAFLALARERPPTPPSAVDDARSLVFDGLRQMLHKRDYLLLMLIFFIGLGIFNAVTTWIEEILRPRGFSAAQAGVAGALMIVAGMVGAVVLPTLSDRYRRRVPFISLALAGGTLGLIGVTYANTYPLLLAAALVMGFFLLASGPIGFQYGAEVAYPAPEGTSNGVVMMMGQISGIVFILGMDALKSPVSGSMLGPLLALIGLFVGSLLVSVFLHEPPAIRAAGILPDEPVVAIESGPAATDGKRISG